MTADELVVSDNVFVFGGVAWIDHLPQTFRRLDEVHFTFDARPVAADAVVDMNRLTAQSMEPFYFKGRKLLAETFNLDARLCEDSRCPQWSPKWRNAPFEYLFRVPFDAAGANPHYHYELQLDAIQQQPDPPPLAITEGAPS